MRVDPNKFKKPLDKLRRHLEGIKPKDRVSLVSKVSSASGIPVYAVCLYLLTYVYPGDRSLEKLMKSVVEFYGYSEVSPFEAD